MEVKNGCISNRSYLSNIAIFHFHDYGRKSIWPVDLLVPTKFLVTSVGMLVVFPQLLRNRSGTTLNFTTPHTHTLYEQKYQHVFPLQKNISMFFFCGSGSLSPKPLHHQIRPPATAPWADPARGNMSWKSNPARHNCNLKRPAKRPTGIGGETCATAQRMRRQTHAQLVGKGRVVISRKGIGWWDVLEGYWLCKNS